ncbi:MAG TPA: sulfatase-like hydrolase/transferase [Polyangiaceae bacterium]|nr:sulfatase-like hydrolase/transferase [Polyangiaceae bacterium]
MTPSAPWPPRRRNVRRGLLLACALLAGAHLASACGSDPGVVTDAGPSPSATATTTTTTPPVPTAPPDAGDAGARDAASPPDATPADASADAPVDSGGDAAVDAAPPIPPNILLVIGDDMGVDSNVCYAVSADPGRAPRIAALCAGGVTFDNAWSMPSCSPTRATIMTGRHGFRTTVGFAGHPLPPGERALPTALTEGNPTYAVGAVGKWHLQGPLNGGANHPNLVGFPTYVGNLQGGVANYSSWTRTVNGVSAPETGYATTVTTNDARDWINAQATPWFLWLAYNSAHSPFHTPPATLHTYGEINGVPPPARPYTHYHAMLEAMDMELGRLLDGLDPVVRARTWVIFVGDNGTPAEVAQAPIPTGHAKGTIYQGGVHVPLTISGPGVVAPGRRVSALVSTVDLFKTILELANVDPALALPAGGATVDSVSVVPYLKNPSQAPLRSWIMTEQFGNTAGFGRTGKTIRDASYKLIRFDAGDTELYDLRVDPQELDNLMAAPLSVEAAAHEQSLTMELDALLASP